MKLRKFNQLMKYVIFGIIVGFSYIVMYNQGIKEGRDMTIKTLMYYDLIHLERVKEMTEALGEKNGTSY